MAAPLEEAQRELEEAGERQREIDRLIAIENQKLEDLRQERANKGRGRPNKTHAGKVKGAEARLARLQRGLLPSEVAPNVPRTTDELVSSARQHPQHHAAASAAPVGRPSGSKRARGEGEPADDGETSDGDGDDGDESPEFKQFYRVSPAQRSFNEDAAHNYMTHELARSEITVHPDNLLASGCKHDLIGVGPVHICAPHKAGWVAERVGSPRPLHYRPTASDVEMLLAQPRDATPAQLSDTAFARGLHLPPSRAEKLAAEAAAEERARLALEEANYRRLQQQLRTRVEPPALREAPPPQLAQAVGGDELPGPLPGMATQAVEPAQLSNGDDADKGPELAAEGGSDGEEAAGGEAMEDDGGGDGGGSGGRRRGGGGGSGRRRGSVGGDGGGRGTQRGGGRGGRGRRGGRGGSGGSGGGSSGGSGRSPIKKRGHDQRGGRSSQQVAADRARRNSEARAAKRAAARAKENAAAAALEQQGAQPAATSSGASATGILAGLHGRIFGSG